MGENNYTQQNYFIQLCMGCTDHLNELEARYHKAQAEAWQRRARQLKDDNLMLHDKVKMLQRHLAWYRAKVGGLRAENAKLRHDLEEANNQAEEVCIENAKLREQMERLVTLLRVDWDIEASWDGLRRFWYVGLTEDGCLMRDRACKPDADTPALLADELLAAHDRCVESGDVRGFEAEVADVAERLRRMGGGDGADD